MNSFEKFASPDGIFAGTDFWMLNGNLDSDEIKYQLCEMKEKGIYSFIARTYIGLQSDYPGPEFKSHLRTIINTAKELGMKVFLQAGYMPEHVLDLPEKYSLNYLKVYSENDNIPLMRYFSCKKTGLSSRNTIQKLFLTCSTQVLLTFTSINAMKICGKNSVMNTARP